MRRPCLLWVVAIALAVSLPMSAAAQDSTSRRHGLWGSVAGGYSSSIFSCDNCTAHRQDGVGLQFVVGMALSERLLIGVEGDDWFRNQNDIHREFANVTAAGYFYPRANGNFFVKAGAGVAYYLFSNASSLDDVGVGLMAGAGYDIPLRGETFITPSVSFDFGRMGDKAGSRGVTINWLTIGAAITWQSSSSVSP